LYAVVFTFIQVKCSVYAHRLVHWDCYFQDIVMLFIQCLLALMNVECRVHPYSYCMKAVYCCYY